MTREDNARMTHDYLEIAMVASRQPKWRGIVDFCFAEIRRFRAIPTTEASVYEPRTMPVISHDLTPEHREREFHSSVFDVRSPRETLTTVATVFRPPGADSKRSVRRGVPENAKFVL